MWWLVWFVLDCLLFVLFVSCLVLLVIALVFCFSVRPFVCSASGSFSVRIFKVLSLIL